MFIVGEVSKFIYKDFKFPLLNFHALYKEKHNFLSKKNFGLKRLSLILSWFRILLFLKSLKFKIKLFFQNNICLAKNYYNPS